MSYWIQSETGGWQLTDDKSESRAIDEHFALWLARVEELVGHKIDPVQARVAYEIYDRPVKAMSPEEYARELYSHTIVGVLYYANWIWTRKGLTPDAMNKLRRSESFWSIPRTIGDWT